MSTLAPGSIFADRYEILALLGAGGMGEVYRAIDVPLCREVAIKVLGGNPSQEFAARFEREAHAIARLDHPGCVRIVDYGRAGDRAFIAMELLDGLPLFACLARDGRFSVARALYIADKLLAALAHAHARGVWHRDLKPENIILVARGALRPVIIDFGLAYLGDDAALTRRGTCAGSPSYVAPERLRSEPYDARADLYAIGVIVYEMLAGARPFTGTSAREIMEQALALPPPPLRVLRPDVSPQLAAVIARALAKDPRRRFADASELRAALAAAGEVEPSPTASLESLASTMIQIPVTTASAWTRAWSWLRYGRWRWRPVG